MKLSGEICQALGGAPPEGFNYELFLDEKGQKISKSKGNGLTIEEWLRYASAGEPVAVHVSRAEVGQAAVLRRHPAPRRRVSAVPRRLSRGRTAKQRLGNPVWHIHSGKPPKADMPISFNMLLTLVSSSNAENAETLWGFIGRYRPGVTPQTHPKLDDAVDYAIHYFRDFVLPKKKFREPSESERKALQDLRDALSNLPADATAEAIQDVVYEVGRRPPFLDEKKKAKDGKPGVSLDWFNMLYQVLLGQEKGPRFGSFVAVYGLKNTVDMIDGALARSANPSPSPCRREPRSGEPRWATARPLPRLGPIILEGAERAPQDDGERLERLAYKSRYGSFSRLSLRRRCLMISPVVQYSLFASRARPRPGIPPATGRANSRTTASPASAAAARAPPRSAWPSP